MEKAGHEIKAAFRRLQFEAEVKLSPAERERAAEWRRQRGIRGRIPTYREVHFWMRAVVILDTDGVPGSRFDAETCFFFEFEGDPRMRRADRGLSHHGFGCLHLPLVSTAAKPV